MASMLAMTACACLGYIPGAMSVQQHVFVWQQALQGPAGLSTKYWVLQLSSKTQRIVAFYSSLHMVNMVSTRAQLS